MTIMLKVEIFFLQLFLKEKENSCKLKKGKKKKKAIVNGYMT